MLYAVFSTLEEKNAFLELFELFAEHRLHLECAVPTAVLMMKERFGIKVHNALLCTDWHGLRERRETGIGIIGKLMVEKCSRQNFVYEAYHPIKLNFHSDWVEFFDYVRYL